MRTRTLLRAGSMVLAVLLVSVTPAAFATGRDGSSEPTSTDVPDTTTGNQSDQGSTTEGQAGACHFVSTVNSLGTACPGGVLAGRKSIKKLMGSETFHKCWYDRFTAEEHQSTGYYDSETQEWWMHRCLEGIDEKTLKITGPIYVTQTPELITKGTTLVHIGPNQQQLVENNAKAIPYPFAVISPMDRARVGGWLSFADGQTVHRVDVPALGAVLSAVEDKITVKPLGAGNAATKVCPGFGHLATAGEKPDPGGNCWFQYMKSSADQPDDTYPVLISAHWTVTATDAGGTRVINEFTKSQVTQLPVTEIQAINVD